MTAKTVLVTGTSSGIGRATAEHFANKGWNVVATMRTPAKETELQKLGSVLVVALDVTKPETITAAVAAAVDKFGAIDVLVNNAGATNCCTSEEQPEAVTRSMFETNVFGLMAVTNAVIPVMRKAKSGVVINISSTIGRVAFPMFSSYAATKFAVEGYTESLSYELASIGVTAKIVAPGATATPMAAQAQGGISTAIAEYEPIVASFSGMLAATMSPDSVSKPELTADVIFTAATDGTQQLRYCAGKDCETTTAQRDAAGLEPFVAGMKKGLGIA